MNYNTTSSNSITYIKFAFQTFGTPTIVKDSCRRGVNIKRSMYIQRKFKVCNNFSNFHNSLIREKIVIGSSLISSNINLNRKFNLIIDSVLDYSTNIINQRNRFTVWACTSDVTTNIKHSFLSKS